MNVTKLKTAMSDKIEVLPLSDHEWRVSDLSKPERDGLALLGFIQTIGTLFEVTAISSPLERDYFGSLDAAVSRLSSVAVPHPLLATA